MKKLLIATLIIGFITQNIIAELKYNPTTTRFYSIPAAPNIDQIEYEKLLLICWDMSEKIINDPAFKGSGKEKDAVADLTIAFLNKVGTPTAFRLLDDLRKLNS